MKKMFLFAAMASVAFASCTTDESVFDAAKEQGKIEFVAANYVAQTRGGHGETTFSNEDFKVYAWETGTDYALMDGVKMVKSGTAWATANSKTYYWPNKKALEFTAVSPAENLAIQPADRTSSGVSTLTFKFDDSYANPTNVNLMYADQVEQTYDYDDLGANAEVALLFRHVLAKLKIVLAQKDPSPLEDGVASYEVIVKDLSIAGIQNKGTLVVDAAYMNAAKGDNANTIWAGAAGNTTWTIFSGKTNSIKGGNYESTAADWVNYYVMPQAVNGQVMTINYDVKTTFTSGTIATREYTRTVNLKDITAVTNWYTNKYITYTINISPADLVPITFSVKEEVWCDDVNGSVDVK